MAGVVALSPGVYLQCGVPFQCSVGAGKTFLQSLSCSLQSLPCRKIGFGVYGISISAGKTSRIMEMRSRLGLMPAQQPRLRYWNDWVDQSDFLAMARDPYVAEEWETRRVRPPLSKPTSYLQGNEGDRQSEKANLGNSKPKASHQNLLQQQHHHHMSHLDLPRGSISSSPGGGRFLGKFTSGAQGNDHNPKTQNPNAKPSNISRHSPQRDENRTRAQSRNDDFDYQPTTRSPTPTAHHGGREGGEEASWVVPFAVSKYGSIPIVTPAEMTAMVRIILHRHFRGGKLLRMFPEQHVLRMAGAVGIVESSLQPFAYRYEERRGEASTGLMQVLQSTADWLVKDVGYTAYEIDWASSMLYRPFVAVYFGLAYMEWLLDYGGKKRGEEFVVRGYNGGPGGAEKEITSGYWAKYQAAKQAFPLPTQKHTKIWAHQNRNQLSPAKNKLGSGARTNLSHPSPQGGGEASRKQTAGHLGGTVLFDLSKLNSARGERQSASCTSQSEASKRESAGSTGNLGGFFALASLGTLR